MADQAKSGIKLFQIEIVDEAAYKGLVSLHEMDEQMKDLLRRLEQLPAGKVALVKIPASYERGGSFRDRVTRAIRKYGKFRVAARLDSKNKCVAIKRLFSAKAVAAETK